MATHQSPFSASETASCSTPGYSAEARKRKRSISGSQPAREYGLMRDNGEHDVARFVGSGSGIHYIRAVYLRLARRSATRTTQATSINNLVPGEDDQLRQSASTKTARQKLLWKPDEVFTDPEVGRLEPSFEDLVEWSKSFFESWHPALPFLHGPDTLRIFEDASKRGISAIPALDSVILKSILSISLADSRQSHPLAKPIPLALVFQSVEEAVASSQFALSQPASIRATQAALAIQLFLTSMLCLNAASRLGGLIVRMAFHLGLHRCPTRFPFFTPEEASVRRRVFWCIYILERFLCQSLGLPLDIQDDDMDVCYPGEEHHGGPNDTADGAGKLQLLTYLAKQARIRGLILELRNKSILKRQDTADRTAFVQTELAKWSNEIQDVVEEEEEGDNLSDTDTPSQPKISSSHRLMLLYLKHESTICLNRPGLASEASSPSYSSAFQACISAAKSICIIFKRHRKHHRISNDRAERRLAVPLLWPSFTWAMWISTFVLVHAAFESQVPLDSALRHVMAGKDMLSHLAARDTAWPEYCLEAIEELISAVRELSSTLPVAQDSADTLSGSHALYRTVTSQSAPSDGPESTSTENKRRGTVSGWGPAAGNGDADTAPGRPFNEPGTITQIVNSGPEASMQHQNTIPSSRMTGYLQPDAILRQRHLRAQSFGNTDVNYGVDSSAIPANQPGLPGSQDPSSSFPVAANTLDVPMDTGPVEGQESMMWYDQLFASSFSAIDNPFLVAAEFDASIDPTWNYLR
ncbi:fungal-specific transcription factor domain-containing protein [Dactylonectria estremocensis]|uniref:Fungal-specific transcription factor domain-containing protein n=1 Tax=Dactylonectria estremocensis TaxID=1079267 RepID=A0A9P9F9J6_9HYPO|nr:fungal-specific transcription factor domain-containing protein [Dactylonectria estremocensis]